MINREHKNSHFLKQTGHQKLKIGWWWWYIYQGVYQPGRPGKPGKIREFQRSGKKREKSGNFVIGQEIFIVFVVNIILRKFAILELIFMLKKFFMLATLAI
jgi:hypothetical protein